LDELLLGWKNLNSFVFCTPKMFDLFQPKF
jgi:hypothetical protein